MTLAQEIRKKAAEAFQQRRDPGGYYRTGKKDGLEEAADLVEADPLYKAAPDLETLVRELRRIRVWGPDDAPSNELLEWNRRAEALIATLPTS